MPETGTICMRARIHGRVQGVFYREWTRRTATRLGLAGWVRNRRDGTVEALLRGPRAALEEMLRRMHDGPPAARVDRVETRETEEAVEESAFRILPTA